MKVIVSGTCEGVRAFGQPSEYGLDGIGGPRERHGCAAGRAPRQGPGSMPDA